MCVVLPPHCNGNQNSQQSGYILNRRFVDCRHGGCRGVMERVVTRWQHPVTSNVALDMLHWALPRALLQHPHGHQNGLRQRHICSLAADILLDTTCS